MTTEVSEKTYTEVERDHITSILDLMAEDGNIDKDLVIMTTPNGQWNFENHMLDKYSSYGSNIRVEKIVSFEDDPLLHAKLDKKKNSSKIYYYPMDYKAGAKFLKEQSINNFNVVWLTFNSVPRWDHMEQINNIASKIMRQKSILILTFNSELTRGQTVQSIVDEFKAAIAKDSKLRYTTSVQPILEEAIEDSTHGCNASECFVRLVPRILEKMNDRLIGSLVYSNYDVDSTPMTTMAFCLGSPDNYIKGMQYTSEAFFYRSNIESPHERFLARSIMEIKPKDDTEKQTVYSGRCYLGQVYWHKTFNTCPVNKYVFINAYTKKGEKSSRKVVAYRNNDRSKLFKDPNGRQYKAYRWAPLENHIWRTKDFSLKRRIMNHNREIQNNNG